MIPALCCRCGTQREVSRQVFTISGNKRLKCQTCQAVTMHALVFGRGIYNDWRERAIFEGENRDKTYDRAGTQPPLPQAPAWHPTDEL